MERRAFVKATCKLCLLAAAGAMLPTLSYAGKTKVYKTTLNENSQAEVPLTLFESGSLQFIRIKGSYYDIALHKLEDGSYNAFLMKCTHMDNQLYITGNGFKCSLHGSEYDKTGAVVKGPAEEPLIKYETSITENNILITVPNFKEQE